MTSERWRQVEALYHAALARSANERPAFLADACANDEDLRRQLESLLDAPATTDGAFAGPALAIATQMVSDPSASFLMAAKSWRGFGPPTA